MSRKFRPTEVWAVLVLVTMLGLAGARAVAYRVRRPAAEPVAASVDPYEGKLLPEASREQAVAVCAACHAFPEPEINARPDWAKEVQRGFDFFDQSDLKDKIERPSPVEVVRFYMNRAPGRLPEPTRPAEGRAGHFRFDRRGYRGDTADPPVIANVRLARLFDDRRPDVLACDMAGGRILALKPYEPDAQPITLAEGLKQPCHAEVVDLDRDGITDILVADLGTRNPSDETLGSVVWLRGGGEHRFTRVPLAEGLGRVADAQAADFDGDGDLDVIAAVFGYLKSGEILYLENRTTDPDQPSFVPRVLDSRDGAIHVPIADLNGDGRPDFVAVISQEHEVVEAFLNSGDGEFTRQTIFTAPHPGFSSNGIQLVDFDRDGDLDVLMTNGDVLDRRSLKPYQGIQWLENRGGYPFVPHRIDSLYGVSRAVAGDLDGDGDLDIAATMFLPGGHWQRVRSTLKLDAVVVLEQTAPGEFARHALQADQCDHPSCDLGDIDGDGRLDLVLSNCIFIDKGEMAPPKDLDWIVVETNPGSAGAEDR